MAETYLSIQEAAAFTEKSIQTIRRALKTKKLEAKRQRTPQGFNYMISQTSLVKFYEMVSENREHASVAPRTRKARVATKKAPLAEAEQTSLISDYASREDVTQIKQMLDSLVVENQKDKEGFMRFAKIFQDRFTAMENQMKLLDEPEKKKKWYKFWR